MDVLVRCTQIEAVAEDLISLGDWERCGNPATTERFPDDCLTTLEPARDVWLRSCIEKPWINYLRLWPEDLYHLSVDCAKIEIPDVSNKGSILLEEEYYPDPHERFGPRRRSTHPEVLLPPLQV